MMTVNKLKTMKISKYIIGLSLLFTVFSCKEDLGNYDYQEINEVAIQGIDDTYEVVANVDTLKIKPIYTMTENADEPGRFSYIWVTKTDLIFMDTLGREKTLNYPVDLAPNKYTLQLRVFDHKTKVTWLKRMNLNVGTAYSKGWLIMGENEKGFADLDMISISKDTLLVKGIASSSGVPTLKGPLLAQHTGGQFETTYRMWLSTSSGAYYLDRASMKANPKNTFGSLIYTTDNINKEEMTPAFIAPQFTNNNGGTGGNFSRAVVTSNGFVFANSLFGAPDYYANPVNRHTNNFAKLLKAAPYLMYSIGSFNVVIWYDTDNDRFMQLTSVGSSTTSAYPQELPGDVFPWNQAGTGRKFRYSENTRNTDNGSQHGNSFAVLVDNTKKSFIYKFYANGQTPQKRALYNVSAIATDFDKADYYAFSSKRTVVFYAVGAKLYAYDYNPGNEKIYEFPSIGVDQITMLKFDTTVDAGTNSLYIATYNNTTKGTLRRFNVGSNPNVVEIQEVTSSKKWEGLVKIKTMNWRPFN